MPYRRFHAAAEQQHYDVERLADRFGVGFEATCHRLSTLQRPGLPGVPFSFVRVDRAGNISKRQSATGFHFSRGGGSCPLWNVYEAFTTPGRILTQVAQMPDGRSYFWIARTVARKRSGYGTPNKSFALGLGCELRHAHRLIYSRGLELRDPALSTPIGMGCKTCERTACPQRAFPRSATGCRPIRTTPRSRPIRCWRSRRSAPARRRDVGQRVGAITSSVASSRSGSGEASMTASCRPRTVAAAEQSPNPARTPRSPSSPMRPPPAVGRSLRPSE